MQQIDTRSALAYLVTRPARPRYQERTMSTDFMAGDAASAQTTARMQIETADRLDDVAARIAACTSGAVPLRRGPLVALGFCLLLACAVSATQ